MSSFLDLITSATDGNLTGAEMEDFLDEHLPCISGERICLACQEGEAMQESEYRRDHDLAVALCKNPTLSGKEQERVLDAAMDWQGKEVWALWALATNPRISDEMKKKVLVAGDLIVGHVGPDFREVAEEYSIAVEENPRFSSTEVEELKSNLDALSTEI